MIDRAPPTHGTGLHTEIVSTTSRRGLASAGLAVIVGIVGGFVGAAWYQMVAPPFAEIGSNGAGLAEVFQGAATGALAGAFAGWFAVGRGLEGRSMLLATLGSILGAVFIVIALSQLGDFTNADGPPPRSVAVAVLAAGGALASLVAVSRLSRSRKGRGRPAG